MPPDQKKFGLGKTTAREMAVAMESVNRCEIADPGLCKRMLEIMRNQQYRNMIPHYIETVDTSETPSAIADKIGALDAIKKEKQKMQEPESRQNADKKKAETHRAAVRVGSNRLV